MEENFEKSDVYKLFLNIISKKLKKKWALKHHELRNIAMSIAPEGNQIIYKFMFLGILNKGVFTVSFIFLFVSLITCSEYIKWQLVLIVGIVMFGSLERHFYFNSVAYKVPFSQAIAKLLDKVKGVEIN